MTATDELRRLLDERGVEYEVDDAKTVRVTRWGAYGDWVSFIEYDTGDTKFCIDARRLTPEQAIEATLGRGDIFTREDVEGAFVSGYSLGLDMFDRTKQDKGWNQNERDLDEEMAELGWVRVSDTEGASMDTDGHDLGHVRNVSATLGRDNAGKYVGLRQGEYWERIENSNYYCGGCGWKVTDHDSYCPECGGALHEAALDSSNCSNSERTTTADETDTWECVCDQVGRYGKRVTVHVMECSKCGRTYEHANGDYEFCSRCGRRVVEVDE